MGYVAELKLAKLLETNPHISETIKYDDHDRTKKGDRVIVYKGHRFIIELKSLQTNAIWKEGNRWMGKAQVDASDRRTVTFEDGSTVETTLLRVGEFDILAVNLFAFEDKWRFVFALNALLPRSTYGRYALQQREQLLASLIPVAWPPEPPFYTDISLLLEELIRRKTS